MPCACQGKGAAARDTFDVVAQSGKTVYSSPSKATAEAVGRRYPNSKVVPRGKNTAAPATAAQQNTAPSATAAQQNTAKA